MELLGGFEYEFGSFLISLKSQYIIIVKRKDFKMYCIPIQKHRSEKKIIITT